jgi:hypothetical protein
MSTTPREAARDHIRALISLVSVQLAGETREQLVAECEALTLAIRAFHMEGIRFRMFNVDRILSKAEASPEVRAAFADARRELEAAGFHTRSHSNP